VDLEPALAHHVGAVLLDQLVDHVVEEVLLLDPVVLVGRVHAEAGGAEALGLLVADVALVGHRAQHLVAPLLGALGVEQRVVQGGRLREPGQQRRLLGPEPLDRLVEVLAGGGLDPDRGAAAVGAVGGRVQVLLEDLVLARAALELLGEPRLLDLGLQVAVVELARVEVLDQLLGDRRAALDDLPLLHVLQRGADDRSQVDPVVLVEVGVLDRDRGLLDHVRDLLQRRRVPDHVGVDDPEAGAVGRVDGRVRSLLDGLQLLQRRSVRGHAEDPAPGTQDGDCEHRADDADAEKDRSPFLSRPAGYASLASCHTGTYDRLSATPHGPRARTGACRGAEIGTIPHPCTATPNPPPASE
jgi:hypothetical protein